MANENQPAPETIPVSEVASRLGVSAASVYRRMQDGTLPSIKFGRRRLPLREPFERLFDQAA